MIGKAPPDLPPPPPPLDPPRRPRPPPPVEPPVWPPPPDDCAQLTLNPLSRDRSLSDRLNDQTPPRGEAGWACGDAGRTSAESAARQARKTDGRMIPAIDGSTAARWEAMLPQPTRSSAIVDRRRPAAESIEPPGRSPRSSAIPAQRSLSSSLSSPSSRSSSLIGRRKCLNAHFATSRPCRRASASAKRKWIPCSTRTSTTSCAASENRL